MIYIDKYFAASLVIWLVATVDAIGGLCGFWSVTGEERLILLSIEGSVLVALLLNCYAIKNWVYRHSANTSDRAIAWIVLAALLLCIGGDLVNFNFPLSYYRYAGVVKHDYLADSVLFFAPGYFIVLLVACWLALQHGLKVTSLLALLVIASLGAGLSFNAMHLPGTGALVSSITGGYAVLIAMVGASGVALLLAMRQSQARGVVWLMAVGLALATVADAVIGQFWIYGNDGEGYFPAARYVNWSLYIASQCLLIHLPRLAVWQSKVVHRDVGSISAST